MASTSRQASSTYGVTPTVGGSTIVHSTVAADEEQSPIDREALTRSPVEVSRYPTVYEQNGNEAGYSRPPSAQVRRSLNVSRMGTSRVESPTSDSNYPSWLPRRPLAPPPPGSTDGGYAGNRSSSAGGYYGTGSRLADLFSFSRGHSRNVTQDSNRVSTAMSGFITNPSDYGGPPGRRMTDGSGGKRKETDTSAATSYGQEQARRGSSGDYDPRGYGRRVATPRSVRIAPGSIDHGRGQEPTDQTRRPSSSAAQGYGYGHSYPHGYSHVRAYSKGAINPYAAAMMSQSPVQIEPSGPGWMSITPQSVVPAPRFNARNLNLSLLRSPSKFIRMRYLLQPVTYFAHVPIQLFFDFNVVYILVQITRYPTPLAPGVPNTSPYPAWLFALIAYLFATLLWLIGVVLIYEIAWCFWRRWRVKRPGMLGIFSSRPARKLVGMGNYDRFCFLEYVQRGAWTDRTELDMLMERERDDHEEELQRRREEEDGESMGGGWEGKKALREARAEGELGPEPEPEPQSREQDDVDDDEHIPWSKKLRLLNYRQGFIEWAWNRSQNLPTVALLIPRACVAFIIILTFTKVNPLTQAVLNSGRSDPTSGLFGTDASIAENSFTPRNSPASRDETFFSGKDGSLTGYAKAVLWIDCIWTLWRILILIGAYVALWIASGQSCAGVCGPRYRSEEMDRQEWEDATNAGLHEKYGSGSRRHLSLSGESTIGGIDTDRGDIADQLGWQWRENTRRRVREAYEFCLLAPLPHRRRISDSPVIPKETDNSNSPTSAPLTGLEQALLASKHHGRKGLAPDLFDKPLPVEDRDLIETIPASHDPSSRSAAGKAPYPFPGYQGGAGVARRDSIPFPSEHGEEGEEPAEGEEGSHIEELIDDGLYDEEGNYLGEVDEMGYLPQRPESASLSSLGQPIHPQRMHFATGRTRSSGSTGLAGSYTYHSPRTSGYKSTSSKSNSGDQTSPRKSSGKSKSSGSHYSRTHKSSGSQQSPYTDSSTNNRLVNILPPPSIPGQRTDRRRAAGSASHLPMTLSPVLVEEQARARTVSHPGSSLHEVAPEPAQEYSDAEEDGNDHAEEEVAAAAAAAGSGGSQDGEEHEDSVGLLSNAPSHQGSLAALRQRAASLTDSIHRLRTRSQGAASQSNSNSGSGSGSNRSRTRSLVTRQQRPESHAMSSLGSGSRSRSRSRSRTSSLVPVIGARYTSIRPTEFGVVRGDSAELGGERAFVYIESQPPVPPLPESSNEESSNRARVTSVTQSERTIQPLQQGQGAGPSRLATHPNLSLDHPDVSEARESFITPPPSVDTSSTNLNRRGRGQGNESNPSVSTWGNVPGYLHDPTPHP
ncbi:hypothetical protein CPB86DRAFT_292115 [Serendipita vermifera]|nr:hypothetical protein CPB86DRAFT_292115 [Serendipita vermifera]